MFAKLDGVDVHYQCVGEGRPILMLHGGYLDHRHMMDEMEPAFMRREGWQRFYLDLPAHGKTASPPWIKTYDDILGVVMAFVEAVIPGQRFSVAGMSAGGHLARGLAAKWPHRLDGVMFNAAAFVIDYAKRARPGPSTIREAADFERLAGDGLEVLRDLQPVRDAELADWYHRNYATALAVWDEAASTPTWEPKNYAFSFDVEHLPEPFFFPTLILAARQDTIVGYRDAWPVVEAYPRATFAVLDGCGHLIAPAKRKLFRALVEDWLDRIEAEIGT